MVLERWVMFTCCMLNLNSVIKQSQCLKFIFIDKILSSWDCKNSRGNRSTLALLTEFIKMSLLLWYCIYMTMNSMIAWNYYDITGDEGDAPGDITADPGERSETDTEITVRDDEHHCRVWWDEKSDVFVSLWTLLWLCWTGSDRSPTSQHNNVCLHSTTIEITS